MTSPNSWLAAAALAAFAVCLTHVFVGGRLFARRLLEAELRPAVKQTMYFCWHLVSVALALMAAGYAWAALHPQARPVAVAATALAAAFLCVNLVQNLTLRLSFARHPQGIFFLLVTLMGGAGLAHG